jgi:hypothetical protein
MSEYQYIRRDIHDEVIAKKDAEIAQLTDALAGYKITDGVAVDKPHKFDSYITAALFVKALAEMMAGKDAEIERLRAENLELRAVFDFAWRLRPMLGAKWDGESDPLELALRELRDEAHRAGQQSA